MQIPGPHPQRCRSSRVRVGPGECASVSAPCSQSFPFSPLITLGERWASGFQDKPRRVSSLNAVNSHPRPGQGGPKLSQRLSLLLPVGRENLPVYVFFCSCCWQNKAQGNFYIKALVRRPAPVTSGVSLGFLCCSAGVCSAGKAQPRLTHIWRPTPLSLCTH